VDSGVVGAAGTGAGPGRPVSRMPLWLEDRGIRALGIVGPAGNWAGPGRPVSVMPVCIGAGVLGIPAS